MKKVKIQIKSIYGSNLFEYEKENNTIKETIQEAYLRGADLRGADLRGANLRGANLRGADLREADLREADLWEADLWGANLRGANLREADLRGADLREADLREADLWEADLWGANLRGADLREADLRGADLRGANLDIIKHQFQIIPMEGSFIAWKKLSNDCVCKIEIPKKAKRTFCIINRKCRAEYVKVLNIWDENGKEIKYQCGQRDSKTIYTVGKLTKADKFNDDLRIDCSHGIHFFVSKQEAIDW